MSSSNATWIFHFNSFHFSWCCNWLHFFPLQTVITSFRKKILLHFNITCPLGLQRFASAWTFVARLVPHLPILLWNAAGAFVSLMNNTLNHILLCDIPEQLINWLSLIGGTSYSIRCHCAPPHLILEMPQTCQFIRAWKGMVNLFSWLASFPEAQVKPKYLAATRLGLPYWV